MIATFIHFIVIVALVCSGQGKSILPPASVNNVYTGALLGRWYQMYTSWVPIITFEKNGMCAVVDFSDQGNGNFRMHFSENLHSPHSHTINTIDANMTRTESKSHNGRFTVKYGPGIEHEREFLLVILPPIHAVTGHYDFVVATDSLGIDLFVFARNVAEFRAVWETLLLVELGGMGFRFPFNRPRRTYQEPEDCYYPPDPTQTKPIKHKS